MPPDEVDSATDGTGGLDGATRLGWIYLASLLAVFIAFAIWVNRQEVPGSTLISAGSSTTTTVARVDFEPVVITLDVDRAVATLSGPVPDEGARDQLVRIAEDRFGRGNVRDELTIDQRVTLIGGTIDIVGVAVEGDDAPQLVQLAANAELGLAPGLFDVEFARPNVLPAEIAYSVGGDVVVVTGVVPDENAVVRAQLSGEAVYGEGSVDVAGLTIGPSTLDGATITVSGVSAPGDRRAGELVQVVGTDFASAIVVDESEIDLGDGALGAFEEQLAETLRDAPIVFDTGTSRITDEGLANLAPVAAAIQSVPDLGVEIVGHTDNTGGETLNEALSRARAEAVQAALIDLGIDPTRLSTRGAGASEPVASNDTAEGRRLNRRIQFVFERGN